MLIIRDGNFDTERDDGQDTQEQTATTAGRWAVGDENAISVLRVLVCVRDNTMAGI